jgi:hypothetical protein
MTLAIQIILLLLFIKFSSYFLLAAFTNLISPIKSSMLKGKCIGTYMYGTHMVTPWNQIIEVEGKWFIDQEYTLARKEYLFGYTKYQVVTPFEDV